MPAPKWYKRRPTLGARNSARQRGGPCSQASGEPERTAHAAGALSRPRAASATFRPRICSTNLSPPLQTALGRTRGILVACRSLSPGSVLSVHLQGGRPSRTPAHQNPPNIVGVSFSLRGKQMLSNSYLGETNRTKMKRSDYSYQDQACMNLTPSGHRQAAWLHVPTATRVARAVRSAAAGSACSG